MSLLKRINDSLSTKAITIPDPSSMQNFTEFRQIGSELTMYPEDGGERFYTRGYRLNDGVYSITTRNADKAGQVRMYHSKIKKEERKTREEYMLLRKSGVFSGQILKEMAAMRKAMVEDKLVDSELSKRLNKPNRNQTQSMWIEQLFLLRELAGEVGLWFNDGADGLGKPLEMFAIPKQHINLIGNSYDPWEIVRYEMVIDGVKKRIDKEAMVRWLYNNPCPVSVTLEHLRGFAPLQSFMVSLQGMNEADKRIATSNANGGAAGMAYKISGTDISGDLRKTTMARNQFDNLVNTQDMAGKIAVMGGNWGYLDFSMSVADQKLLEQYNVGFERLCRVFKTPHGLFNNNATYDNQNEYKKDWIYSKIAPAVYGLADLLNGALLQRYGLDPETNLIDCDVMSLPEMTEDIKAKILALKDAPMTVNEKRGEIGYEPLPGKEGELFMVPSGYQSLTDLADPLGVSNEADSALLD